QAQSSRRGFGFGQWWTLVRRNVLLKVRDRAQSIILLVQAPLFGILLGAVFGSLRYSSAADWDKVARSVGALQFLMVLAAVWFGCNNVARDIVGEWSIFQRERMVSLKLPSYLFSKLTIAAILCLFQCGTLLGIVTLICHLQGNFLQILAILYLSSLVGAAIGLCVSARASTTEAAIAMLPLILLPVIALGGGLLPIHQMPQPVQRIAKVVPSRWAFEAALVTEGETHHYSDCDEVTKSKTTDYLKAMRTECEGVSIADWQFPSEHRVGLRTCLAALGGMLVFWISTRSSFCACAIFSRPGTASGAPRLRPAPKAERTWRGVLTSLPEAIHPRPHTVNSKERIQPSWLRGVLLSHLCITAAWKRVRTKVTFMLATCAFSL